MTSFARGVGETITRNDNLSSLMTILRVLLLTSGFTNSGFTATGFTFGSIQIDDIPNKYEKRKTSSSISITDNSSSIFNIFGNLRFAVESISKLDSLQRIATFLRKIGFSGFSSTGFTTTGFTIAPSTYIDDQTNIGIKRRSFHSFPAPFNAVVSVKNALGNLRYIEDTLPRNDSVEFIVNRFRTILESGGFTNSGFTATGFLVGNDTIRFSDKISTGVMYNIQEPNINISDALSSIKNILGNLRYIVDNSTISDVIKKGISLIVQEGRGFTIDGFTTTGFTYGGVVINDLIQKSKGLAGTLIENGVFDSAIMDPSMFDPDDSIVVSDVIETLQLGLKRSVSETITLNDSIQKNIHKLINEVSGFTFTGFTQTGFVLNQYFVSDTVITLREVTRTIDVTITRLDSVIRVINELGNLRFINYTVSNISDNADRIYSALRNPVEQFGFTLSGFTRSGFTLDAGVPILDSVALTKQELYATISEISGFTVTGFTDSGFFKQGGVFIGDAVSRSMSTTINEVISRSDSILSGLEFSIIDIAYSVSDSITKRMDFVSYIQQTKGFTDSGFVQSGFTFATGVFVGDQLNVLKHIGNLFRSIYEVSGFTLTGFTTSGFYNSGGVFIGDIIKKNINSTIENTVTLSQTVARSKSKLTSLPSFLNDIDISDGLERLVSIVREITASSGFTQSGFTVTGFTKGEAIYVLDLPSGISRITTLFRTVVETSGFTLTGFTNSGFFQSGGVYITDVVGKQINKLIADTFSINDSVLGIVGLKRLISDIEYDIVDSVSFVKGYIRNITDGGFTRSGFTSSGFFVDSSIFVSDVVTQSVRVANHFRTIFDLGGFTVAGFTTSGFLIGGVQVFDYVNSFTSKLRTIEEQSIWDFNIFDPEVYGSLSVGLLDTIDIVKNINGNMRFATETITVTTQSIVKDISKTIFEGGGFTSTGFNISGFLIGGVAMSDVMQAIKTTPRSMLDTISNSDILYRQNWMFRKLLDLSGGYPSYEIIDLVKKLPSMSIFDTIVLGEVTDRTTQIYKLISDTLPITDTLINGNTFYSVIDDIEVAVSDVISKSLGFTINDIQVNISDNVISQINLFGTLRDISDSVNNIAQSITKDVTKSILEGFVGFTKTGFTTTGFSMIGGVGIYDTIGRIKGYTSIINDTVVLSDSISRIINELGNLRYIVETITPNDSVDRVIDIFRELLQIAGFTQTGFTSSGFFLTGGVNIIDFVENTKKDLTRTISEVSGFTLTGFTETGFYLNGGVFVNDVISKAINKIISENVSSTSIVQKVFSRIVTISENETISDNLSSALALFRTILQQNGFTLTGFTPTGFSYNGVAIFDTIQRVRSNDFFRVIEESSGFSITGFTDSGFYINGGVFINDVVQRVGVFSRSVSFNVLQEDSINIGVFASITDSISQSDLVSNIIEYLRSISEASGFTLSGFTDSGFVHGYAIDVSDVLIGAKGIENIFRSINEISGFTFSGFTNTGFYVGGVTIIDTLTKGITYSIQDTFALSQSVVGTKNAFGTARQIFDNITPQSFIGRLIGNMRDIFEVRGFTFSGFTRSGFVFAGGVYMEDFVERVVSDFGYLSSSVGVISDSVTTRIDYLRTLIENVTSISVVNRVTVAFRNIFESSGFTLTGFTLSGFFVGYRINISDSLTSTRGVFTNIPLQSIGIVDLLEQTFKANVIMEILDSISSSQIVSRNVNALRNVFDVRGFTPTGFTLTGFTQNGVGVYDYVSKIQSSHLLRDIFETSGFTLTGFTLSGFTINGGVYVGDIIDRLTNINISLSESVSITGIPIRVISYVVSIPTDIINVSDSIGKVIGWFRYISESSGFTLTGFTNTGFVQDAGIYVFDNVVQLKETGNLFREIYDTSGFTITGFTSSGFYINGGVFINDIISKTVTKTVTSIISTSDLTNRELNPLFRLISDSNIIVSDSVLRLVEIVRNISLDTGFTSTGFTLSGFYIVDTGVSVDDVNQGFIRLGNFFRYVQESSGFTISGFTDSGFLLGGGVAVNDVISRVYRSYKRKLVVSTNVSDTISGVLNLFGKLVVITDLSISVADSIRKDITKIIAETTGFTFTGFTESGFSIFSTGIITDSVLGVKGIIRSTSSSVSFGIDSITSIKNLFGSIRNNIETAIILDDSVVRVVDLLRDLNEIAGFTQTGFTDSGFFKQGGALISDIITGVRDQEYIRNIVDSGGFTLTGFTITGFTSIGGVQIYDIVDRLQTRFIGLSDIVTLSDKPNVSKFRIILNEISVLDSVAKIYNALRNITATAGFTFTGFTTSGFTLGEATKILDSVVLSKDVGNLFRTILDTGGFVPSGFTSSGFTIFTGTRIYDIISKNVGKQIINTLSNSDIVGKDKGINLTSIVLSSSSVIRLLNVQRIINEFRAFTLTGFTFSGFTNAGVNIKDVLNATTRIGRFYRYIEESSGFTNTGFTLSGFTVGVNLQFQEFVEGVRGAPREISETITRTDSVIRVITSFRTLTDNVFIDIDQLETSATDLIVGVNEIAIVISDSVEKLSGLSRVLSENTTYLDTLTRTITLFRLISEIPVNVDSSVQRVISSLRSIVAPTISVSDIIQKDIIKNIFETIISVTDSITKDITKLITEPSISVTDSLERVRSVLRNYFELTYNVTDNISKDILKNIFEVSVSVPDAVDRTIELFRNTSSTVTFGVDILVRNIELLRNISAPSITISDSISKDILKNIFDVSISVTSTVDRTIELFRVVSESVSVPDSVDRTIQSLRSILDTDLQNAITDSISKDVLKNIFQTITRNDTIKTIQARTINELVSSISIVSRKITFLRNILDVDLSGAISDLLNRTISLFRNISEISVSVDSSVQRVILSLRSITDSVSVPDSVDRTIQSLRSLVVASSISDLVSRNTSSLRLLSSSIVISDNITKDVLKNIYDSAITVSDSVDRTIELLRNIEDISYNVTDIISKYILKNIFEVSISVTDSISKDVLKNIYDSVSVPDFVDRTIQSLRLILDTDLENAISDIINKDILKNIFEVSVTITDNISKNVLKNIFEVSVTITDNISKDVLKNIFDVSISVTDNIIKDILKNISDSVSILDSVDEAIGRSIIDTDLQNAITDNISKDVLKNIFDVSISVTDNISKDILKNIFEVSISISDSISTDLLRNIFEISISVSDNISKDILKNIFDVSISVSDNITKDIVKYITDSISRSDSVVGIKNILRFVADEIEISLFDDFFDPEVYGSFNGVADYINIGIGRFIQEDIFQKDIVNAGFFALIDDVAITITDSITKDVTKVISESITITDNISKDVVKYISETVSITDDLSKDILKNIFEISINVTDNISKDVLKNIFEVSISISDDILKDISKNIVETISVSDQVLKDNILKNIIEVSYNVTDNISKDILKNIFDVSISVTDNISKDILKNVFEISYNVTDNISKDILKNIFEISVSISDNITKDILKNIFEVSYSITDNISKDVLKNIFEISISVSDNITKDIVKFIIESSYNVTDLVTKDVGKFIGESISITDDISKDILKNIFEVSVSISDSINTNLSLNIVDIDVIVTDNITKDIVKYILDSVNVSDNISKDVLKNIFDNDLENAITDNITMGMGVFINDLSINITDAIGKDVVKVITETVSITDNIIKDIIKNISENVVLSDVVSDQLSVFILESVDISDLIQKDILKNIFEFISKSDKLTKSMSYRIFDPRISISDDILLEFGRFINELDISVTDAIGKDVSKTIIESVLINDLLNFTKGKLTSITDLAIVVSDNISKDILKNIFETISIIDSLSKDILKNVYDAVSIADQVFGEFIVQVALASTSIVKLSLQTTSLITESATIPFKTIIKDEVLFTTIVKQSILINTIIRQAITFNSIVRQAITFNSIIKSQILFNTLVRQSILFNTIIKDSIIFTTTIKNIIDFITKIKIVLYFKSLIGNDGK